MRRRSGKSDKAEFNDCEGLKETKDGLLVKMSDGQEIWFPKSQILDESEVYEEGGEGMLVVTEWIAIQKGLV